MLQVGEMGFHYANTLVVLRICAPSGALVAKKCILLTAMLPFHPCVFTHSISQGWANLFKRKVIFRNQKHQRAASQFEVSIKKW